MQFKEWQRGPNIMQEVFAGFIEQRKLQQKWNGVVYFNEFWVDWFYFDSEERMETLKKTCWLLYLVYKGTIFFCHNLHLLLLLVVWLNVINLTGLDVLIYICTHLL